MNFTVSRVVNACIASIFLTERACCSYNSLLYHIHYCLPDDSSSRAAVGTEWHTPVFTTYSLFHVESALPPLTDTYRTYSVTHQMNEELITHLDRHTKTHANKDTKTEDTHWPRNPLTTGFHQKAQIRHKTYNLPKLLPLTCRSFLPTMRMNTLWGFYCCVKKSLLISETTI